MRAAARRRSAASSRGERSRASLLLALERRIGFTTAGMSVLALTVAGLLIGRRLASRPLLMMVYALGSWLLVAWLLGRRRVAVEVGRGDIPGRVRNGQSIEVSLTLTARRRLTTVVLEETLSEHLGGSTRFPVPVLPAGEVVTHTYTLTPARRGRYELGPLVAEWSDPFGLTRRRLVLDEPVPLIVHPSTEPVHDRVISRAWEDPPLRPPLSKPWPTGFEFYGMRDYVSGDDPRRIVWRATARSLDLATGAGRYLVREAEQGITDRVEVFLDTARAAHSPGETSDTFELAVRAVASLGIKHLHDGFGVTLHGNSDRIAANLRGRKAEIDLLDRLAIVEREDVSLTGALERLLASRRGHAHHIIVTPDISKDVALRLRLLIERGVSIMLGLVVTDETDPVVHQRAATLGCTVVEMSAGVPLQNVFRHALGARA